MGLFDVAGDAYGRFMGRFSEPLADAAVSRLDLAPGQRALDVGCGPGALTARLADRLGAASVTAVDPSSSFVEAVRRRLPEVDVRESAAEQLPFADASFERTVAQLVVHFMSDPTAGLAEMGRVTGPGGLLAASVWDHAGGRGPLSPFWDAVHGVDPGAADESSSPGSREGHLAELFVAAGLHVVDSTSLTVAVDFSSFEEWWEPYTLGVGPAGAYVGRCDEARRTTLERECRRRLPAVPFRLPAVAWFVVAQPS